jgi:hypothetical protein
MPFNQLLLPLLGGFLFISHWRRTKYHVLRIDGPRLLFYASCAGVLFLLLSIVIDMALRRVSAPLVTQWYALVGIEHTGKPFVAFLLGALGWYPLNRFLDDGKEAGRVIEEKGSPIERLLRRTMADATPVLIATKGGGIHVGYVTVNVNPALFVPSLQMAPVMSGHRGDDTKTIEFSTFYPDDGGDSGELGLSRFLMSLPLAEIASAQRFDAETYAVYFEQRRQALAPPPPRDAEYESYTASEVFEVGRRFLLAGAFGVAETEFKRAMQRDHGNADYRFFLGLIQLLQFVVHPGNPNREYWVFSRRHLDQIQEAVSKLWTRDVLGLTWKESIEGLADKQLEAFLLQVFDARENAASGPLTLAVNENGTACELFFEAYLLAPERYAKVIDILLKVTSSKSPLLDLDFVGAAEIALERSGANPMYYQFVALALVQEDRLAEIDLLAERAIARGAWEAAEAIYALPLKFTLGPPTLQASLDRVRLKQPPLPADGRWPE